MFKVWYAKILCNKKNFKTTSNEKYKFSSKSLWYFFLFFLQKIPFVIFPSVSMVILLLKEDYEVFLDLYFPKKKKMESEN